MMNVSKINESHYRILTANARGAIACVKLVGPDLVRRISTVFRPANRKVFARFAEGSLVYGLWDSGAGEGEDIVLCPLSDNEAEVHCHGGAAAVAAIARSLEKQGFKKLNLESGATLDEKWVLELENALSRAQTERTAKIILRQLNLSRDKETLSQQLSNPDSRKLSLDWFEFGRHLIVPREITLYGSPNVGKSSLINSISGFDRVIVHDSAGTTRDIVRQATAIHGWPVTLADTAGIRATHDTLESQGIEAALNAIRTSDVRVLVLGAQALSADFSIQGDLQESLPDLIVINKCDLVSTEQVLCWSEGVSRSTGVECIFVSATKGTGLEGLTEKLGRILVPQLPPSDVLIPITPTMAEWLRGEKLVKGKPAKR